MNRESTKVVEIVELQRDQMGEFEALAMCKGDTDKYHVSVLSKVFKIKMPKIVPTTTSTSKTSSCGGGLHASSQSKLSANGLSSPKIVY